MKSCCRGLEEQFDDRQAARDLRRFRRRGPNRATRLLLDGLTAAPVHGLTHLDIGGGVGALQHCLLAVGVRSSCDVDASPAYVAAAREEGQRRGTEERMSFRVGDFVDLAGEIEPADLVTLDRVICCYPDMPRLVQASASRARRLYGIVVPRTGPPFRAAAWLANLFLRLRGSDFRVYLHDGATLEERIRSAGFVRVFRRATPLWQAMVYRRTGPA